MENCATANLTIEQQARLLADESRKTEPEIEKIYWFPHDREVRLVQLSRIMPAVAEPELHPFYFNPSPEDGLTAPSAMSMIRPQEFGKLALPQGWCDWTEAVEV